MSGKDVRSDGSELVKVIFRDGPLGVKLRRRPDDGIAFVFEVVDDSQAVNMDVIAGDEIWSIGEYDLGETFLDKDAWGSLIDYIKFCPRPLSVVLRRKSLLSSADKLPEEPVATVAASIPIDYEQLQLQGSNTRSFLSKALATRSTATAGNRLGSDLEEEATNGERRGQEEAEDNEDDEDVEIPLHSTGAYDDAATDRNIIRDSSNRNSRRTASSTLPSQTTDYTNGPVGTDTGSSSSPPTAYSNDDRDDDDEELLELSSRLILKDKTEKSSPFVGALAKIGAAATGASSSGSGAGSMNLVKEGRKLLRTGDLQVKSKIALWSTQSLKSFFLLSDILIVATHQGQQYLVDHVIDLQACKVKAEGQDQQTSTQSSGAAAAGSVLGITGSGQQFGGAALAFVGAVGEQIRQQTAAAAGLSPMQSPQQPAPQFPFTITWPGGCIEALSRTQDEKNDWVNSIYAAVCASVGDDERTLGWRHQYKSGTMHSAVIARDEAKVRALVNACESGQLEYEAIESVDEEGYTPLHYACILRFPVVVRILLEAGVSGMVPDRNGFTPLHWAALQLDSQSLKHLCAFATDVDVPDHDYRTPLYLACVEGRDVTGRTDCAQLRACIAALVERGADVNVRDANGVSLLHYLAASWQYEPLEELLLAPGANIHVTDDIHRQTVIHFAAAAMPMKLALGEGMKVLSGNSDIAAELGEVMHGGRNGHHHESDEDAPEKINLLDATNTLRVILEHGVRGNVHDATGLTALQVLCDSSDRWGGIFWDAVGTMLSYGVRLDDSPQSLRLKSSPSIPLGEPIEQWTNGLYADADRANLPLKSLALSVIATRGKSDTGRGGGGGGADAAAASTAAAVVSADKERSKNCSLCGVQFTLFRRQHHCKMCLSSCCDDCSKKKVLVQSQQLRCCDACYNLIVSKVRREEIEEDKLRAAATAAARANISAAAANNAPSSSSSSSGGGAAGSRWAAIRRAGGQNQSQGQSPLLPPGKANNSFSRGGGGGGGGDSTSDAENRRDLFGSLGSSISGSIGGILSGVRERPETGTMTHNNQTQRGGDGGGGRDAGNVRGGVGATMSVMNELQERMAERGEKISRVADRSAEMSNAASEFSKLARQLNQQQQNRWF